MAAVESTFRVFHFSPQLVEAFRKSRDRQELITRDFVSMGIDKHLSSIVRELKTVGLVAQSERQVVRLEMRLDALADLSGASAMTGVPATTLLSICLARAAGRKRRG